MEKGEGAQASIVLRREKQVEDLSGRVHQVPCCVKYDGAASVSDYFKPKPTGVGADGLPLQQAHFRGRLLQGTTLPLPHGYSGFVLGKTSIHKNDSAGTEEEEEEEEQCHLWETSAVFGDITYWNHDFVPSHNDDFFRAFHWLPVAKALHNPVTPEELASSSVPLQRL